MMGPVSLRRADELFLGHDKDSDQILIQGRRRGAGVASVEVVEFRAALAVCGWVAIEV